MYLEVGLFSLLNDSVLIHLERSVFLRTCVFRLVLLLISECFVDVRGEGVVRPSCDCCSFLDVRIISFFPSFRFPFTPPIVPFPHVHQDTTRVSVNPLKQFKLERKSHSNPKRSAISGFRISATMDDPFSSSEKEMELESIVSPIRPRRNRYDDIDDDDSSEDSILNPFSRNTA